MATTIEFSHLHRFEPATVSGMPPVLLLHGTGGDENDLLPLGRIVAPGAALLSPRGKVLEGGMPRFFRRLAEGVFDEEDVRRRANELADFVQDARDVYRLHAPIAAGVSNGANKAPAMLQLRPEILAGGVPLRALVPLKEEAVVALAGKPVLILWGSTDPIVPAWNAPRLASGLKSAGANVDHRTLPAGHGLSQADVAITKTWLDQR